jgi:hypothetical protein
VEPAQLLVVAAVVAGVILLDRRVRRTGLTEPGLDEPWTASRVARLLVKVVIGLAVLVGLGLVLQALRIEVGFLGFGPDGTPP